MISFSGEDLLVGIALIGGLIAAILIAAQLDEWRARLSPQAAPRIRETIMQTIRQRAAFVICAGLAIILLDYTFAAQHSCDPYLQTLHHSRLPVLFGGLVTLLGLYHWIAAAPDKI